MARASFGGGVADFVVIAPAPGDPLRFAAATLTMWDAETGGTRYTDLLLDGDPVTSIPVGVDGQVPTFQGPDGVVKMWAQAGTSSSRAMLDAAGDIAVLAQVAVVEAQAARDEAVEAKEAAEAVGATTDAQLNSLLPGKIANPTDPVGIALSASIDGRVNKAMYIDWTTKPNGDPPSAADTGQPANFLSTVSGRKPQVSGGRLVHGTISGSGSYADYYQVNLGAKATSLVVRWNQPASPDANGLLCVGAWASVYQPNLGVPVPSSVVHLTLKPGTGPLGSYIYGVWDGAGASAVTVKSGSYVNQPADGKTVLTCTILIDRSAGLVTVVLPDQSTITVSDAEISAAFTAAGVTPIALADLGANVVFTENFASTGGDVAVYPSVIDFAADTAAKPPIQRQGPSLDMFARLARAVTQTRPPKWKIHQSTYTSAALTTSPATVDSGNLFVLCEAGPTGSILCEVSGGHYDFTADTTVWWRVHVGGGGDSTTVVAVEGKSGVTGSGLGMMELTGLTPGTVYTLTLRHFMTAGGAGTLSLGSGKRAINFKATPA